MTSWIPVPARDTLCSPLVALSSMVSVALRVPLPEGVNKTAILQDAPAAIDDPQVFVSVKFAALAPLMERLVILRLASLELLSVTAAGELAVAMGWLPKLMCVAERLAPAAVEDD